MAEVEVREFAHFRVEFGFNPPRDCERIHLTRQHERGITNVTFYFPDGTALGRAVSDRQRHRARSNRSYARHLERDINRTIEEYREEQGMAQIRGRNCRIQLMNSDGEVIQELGNATIRWRVDYASEYQGIDDQIQTSKRAKSLLLECLTPTQQEQFDKDGSFIVSACSGQQYRIKSKTQYNVRLLDGAGNEMAKLCAVPDWSVPLYDQMLSQKLWLENDEVGFREVANWNRTTSSACYVQWRSSP